MPCGGRKKIGDFHKPVAKLTDEQTGFAEQMQRNAETKALQKADKAYDRI